MKIISGSKREEKIKNLSSDMRDRSGKFLKGRPNPYKKSFSKNYNVHVPQIYWEKEWLIKEYINKNRTAEDIAKEFMVDQRTIRHWLKKHNIYKDANNTRSK